MPYYSVCKMDLVSGHGEWEDDSKTRCRILRRKPEQLASDIYDWAETNGYINSVCTVYELHSGGSILFMRALFYLVTIFNCVLIEFQIFSVTITTILGEDVNGMLFQGADEKLLRRALAILETQGKCTMFKGDTSSEDGIKFF